MLLGVRIISGTGRDQLPVPRMPVSECVKTRRRRRVRRGRRKEGGGCWEEEEEGKKERGGWAVGGGGALLFTHEIFSTTGDGKHAMTSQ